MGRWERSTSNCWKILPSVAGPAAGARRDAAHSSRREIQIPKNEEMVASHGRPPSAKKGKFRPVDAGHGASVAHPPTPGLAFSLRRNVALHQQFNPGDVPPQQVQLPTFHTQTGVSMKCTMYLGSRRLPSIFSSVLVSFPSFFRFLAVVVFGLCALPPQGFAQHYSVSALLSST